MNSKLFGLFAFGVLALVLVMSLASAALTVSSSTINAPTSNSTTITVNNTELGAATLTVAGDFTVSLSTNSAAPGITNVTVTLVSDINTIEAITSTVTITATAGPVVSTGIVSLTKALCSASNPGQLEIKGIDFANKGLQYSTFGEDDEWFPFEEVEVEIEVENNGNDNVDDISLQWGVYDTKSNKWVIDLDEEDELNIKDGDKEVLTVSFKLDDDLDVDLDELNDGANYRFYVVAEGTVDNTNSTATCVSDYEAASVVIESDFVILDNFEVPETVSCGASVEISADVWNVGDSDQDAVSVYVSNKELGLSEDVLLGDIDAFDNQQLSLSFNVPTNAMDKTYPIKFEVYDEDGDVYQNDYNDDDSTFIVPMAVSNCAGSASPVTISASLVSGGRPGQDLVVKTVVTNTGSSSATYLLSSTEHGLWASSYTAQPSTLTLAAGQSGESTFTFKVNKDASGEKTFYIETLSGTQVAKQPVKVMIENTGFFNSLTGGAVGSSGWVWGLGALNVLLILVIILVAVRVMRK